MRSHAKASSAESIAGSGDDRSLLRRAFATLGVSREIKGSSARSFRLFCLAMLAAALVPLIGPAGAKAAPGYQDIGGFGEFFISSDPGDFAIDGDDNRLVTNFSGGEVQVLGPAGNPIGSFGPGVLLHPYGIATDPANDLVYVSTEATNESGAIRLGNAGSGTFTLSFKGNTTAALPYDATAAKVEAALEALPSVGADNIDVYFGPGTYGYAFNGDLAGTEVPALGINGAALGAGGAAIFIGGTPPNQNVKLISAAGGTFTLGFDGQTTGPITYNATPAAVDSALEALSTVGAGNVSVAAGGPGEYAVSFEGMLATTTEGLSADASSLTPEAPKPEVTVEQEGGPSRIVRYESDGGSPPKFTFDPTYSGPVQGSGPGQIGDIASPLELDPISGDLLVADKGKKVVSRYDDTGALVDSYDGAGSAGGAFKTILDFTALPDGGTCVVADGVVGAYNTVSGSRVVCLAADGTATETLSGSVALGAARAIGYDAVNNRLVVGVRGGQFTEGGPGAVLYYSAGVLGGEILLGGGSFQTGSVPLRIEGVPSGRVLVLEAGEGRILAPVFLPELDQPSELTTTSAKLVGRVQADGKSGTHYRFEYSADQGATWLTAAEGDVGSGTPETIETTLAGLVPNFEYRARLAFTNDEGTAYSQVRTFSTATSPPAVTTEKFADLTDTSVTLYGKVNPFAQQTSYHFEYGTTTAYGSRVPVSNDVAAGQGRSPLTVSQSVTGLQPGTTYHYRLVAENATGSTAGEDLTFTTLGAGSSLNRVYELVSPPEKGAASIRGILNGGSTMQASLDGEGIAFGAFTQFSDAAQDAPYGNKWIAYRSPTGWTSYSADAPQIHPNGWFPIQLTMGISEDLSRAVTMSLLDLAPGAVELQSNAYVKDLKAGSYKTLASLPGETWWKTSQQYSLSEPLFMFVNGSPNFDHILIRTATQPFEGAPEGALFMYEDSGLRLISKAPDGTPIDGGGRGSLSHDLHNMSPDGSRVAFISPSLNGAAVINVNGQTKVISESQRAADPEGTYRPSVGESFVGGGVDLNEVYFFSHDILDSDSPGVNYLYRYDLATEDLTRLAPAGDNPQYTQVSRDGGTIYWRTSSALLPGDEGGAEKNTYVWRDGEMAHAASLPLSRWNISPDGRYMAYIAKAPNWEANAAACSVGSNDDVPCFVVYRYDADAGETICLSCLPDGGLNARPTPSIGPIRADFNPIAFGHPVTDSGQVFFDTADQLVVADVNSKNDVYEYSDAAGVRLISSGTGEGAYFADASLDGRDVFFTTNDKMVRADFDNSTDLYDARVGGGIPGQNDPPFSACAREDCRGQAPVPPAPPPGGSETTFGPGTKSARKGKSRKPCPKGRHKQKAAASKSKSKAKARCAKNTNRKSAKKNRGNDNRRQGR